jgi:hypothetical protein
LGVKFLLLLFILITVSSCARQEAKDDFYSNASELLVNSASEGVLSFGLTLFTKTKIHMVECIGLDGSGINYQDCNVEVFDNNVDRLKAYHYKGLYVQTLLITITPRVPSEKCSITRIHLNVDGEKHKVDFPHPLTHDFTQGNVFTEELRISVIPNEFPSRFINDDEQLLTYMFTVTEDVVLEEIACTDFLELTDFQIRENGILKGDCEFPVSFAAGSDVDINFRYISDLANECSYVATTLIFRYRKVADNEELANKVQLIFDPIYPISDNNTSPIDHIIDRLLSN